jgi:hypothetical protein
MKIAAVDISGMERRTFQNHTFFSNLYYRSGQRIIEQNRPQALAASNQTLGCGHALA